MHLFTLLKFLSLQQKHFTDRQYNTSMRHSLRRVLLSSAYYFQRRKCASFALPLALRMHLHSLRMCVCMLRTICYVQSLKCRRHTSQIKVITAMLFLVKRSILILFRFIVSRLLSIFRFVIVVACCLLFHFTADLFSTVLYESKKCSYCT